MRKLAIVLCGLVCMATSGCATDQVGPRIQLGLQLSEAFCSGLLDAQPKRADTLAVACRAFLGRPAPAEPPADNAPAPI